MNFSNDFAEKALHKKNILGKVYTKQIHLGNKSLYSVNMEYFVNQVKHLSSGLDFDFEKAYLKAFMEAVEWYSISNYKNEKFVNGRHADIRNSIAPNIFSIIKVREADPRIKQQFLFSNNTAFKWTKMFSIKDKKEVYVPTQLVYSGYKFDKGEKTIRVPISTGSAAGFSRDFCLAKGILEVIERDNFTLHWLSKVSPKIINYTDNNEISSLISLFKKETKATIFILDFSYDFSLYVIGILLLNTDTGMASIGLGSDFNLEKATIHALLEAYKLFESQKYLLKRSVSSVNKTDEILDLTDLHSIFLFNRNIWLKDKPIHKIKFLLDGKIINSKSYEKRDAKSTLKEKRQFLLNLIMEKYGYDIYIKKYYSLNKKVIVIKTLIPQMLPLYLSEKLPFEFTKRLKRFYMERAIKGKRSSIIGPPFF